MEELTINLPPLSGMDKDHMRNTVQSFIKAAMKLKKISYRKLDAKIGMHWTKISTQVNGKESTLQLYTLVNIMDALGYDVVFVPRNKEEK
jgi:DNA-binding Xre family transcriptional regulator